MDNNFLENRDLQILKKILSEIKLIENWCVALDKNLFLEDELTQRAVTIIDHHRFFQNFISIF